VRDLRGACRPIRDQGRQLACVAFAGTASHELTRGDGVELSQAFLHWACKARDGLHPRAGTTLAALESALTAVGQARADFWPYRASQGSEEPGYGPTPEALADAATRILGPGRLIVPTAETIRSIVDSGTAPVVGLRVFRAFCEAGPQTLIDLPPATATRLGEHAVTVVGYDDKGDLEFVIRNSWGLNWGADGYGRLSRGYVDAHALLAWLPGAISA
jgi:hypothetical protein